jgi:DNA polymerase-1
LTRTLLLDADLLAYQASSANQRAYDWNGDGNKSVAADEAEARRYAEEAIVKIADKLKADDVIVCLSDDFNNFRKDRVDPTYKAARTTVDRPVHLYDLKDWLAETYTTERWAALEADDVMGILATDPTRTDERIIVSADKDMMQIPGKLFRPATEGRPEKLMQISVEEADRFHLYQTIVGDITDGYPGLPGAGPVEAERLLAGEAWVGYPRTISRGPRKGTMVIDWKLGADELAQSAWDRVVSAYYRRGLTQTDAIKQARLARILRYDEWDGRSPRLWTPPY